MRETRADCCRRRRAARDLARQLERDGYLVLPAPTVLGEQIAELWRAGEAFFALPRGAQAAQHAARA